MKLISGASLAITSKSGFKPFFATPAPAGRRITAGFSYLQRIGKSAAIDVWFPDCIKNRAEEKLSAGIRPGPEDFPAEWAAVRQFELLQEAGNHKIYDLDPEHLMRTLRDITAHMKGGGYRVTVVTIGSYAGPGVGDELAILDRRLQDRISSLINMLYLEEQSERIAEALTESLRQEKWDYQTALPHVGVTLGARDLFKPNAKGDAAHRHFLARKFFEILSLLPQKHIVHDTAVGLQLPEAINENQWIYIARDGEKVGDFVRMMDNLFAPFNKLSMSELDGRADGASEIKPMVGHMRGYGDRLNPESERFLRNLLQHTVH